MTPTATKSNPQKFELRNKIGFSRKIRSFSRVIKLYTHYSIFGSSRVVVFKYFRNKEITQTIKHNNDDSLSYRILF